MLVTQTHVKDFNAALLREELDSALPGRVGGITWLGFAWNGVRLYVPIAAPRVVSRTQLPDGTVVEVTAQPGELAVTVPDNFSGPELTTLTTVLTAHDATQRTAEQQRRLLDLVQMSQLFDLLQLPSPWAAADLEQAVRLCARLLLRELRTEAI